MESTGSDFVNVRLIDIVVLDALKDFAIDGEGDIRLVVARFSFNVADGDISENKHRQNNDDFLPKWTHVFSLCPALCRSASNQPTRARLDYSIPSRVMSVPKCGWDQHVSMPAAPERMAGSKPSICA